MLEHREAGRRLADAFAHRQEQAGVRTVNRELSALRSAIGWWRRREWISSDPTATLRLAGDRPAAARPLTDLELAALFRQPAGLRDQAFWHLLGDSGAAADVALTIDAGAVDLPGYRARAGGGTVIQFGAQTGELLGWLLAGRRHGPVFLTDRRAPAGTSPADVCAVTGRGRMSYRRAAEIFAAHTRELDPAGRGWMLHQLRRRIAG
jgi:integrase/recombinase XerD